MLRWAVFILITQLAVAAVTYSYDDAARLTKVDYGDGRTITYVYDKAGNLLSRTATPANSATQPKAQASKPDQKPSRKARPATETANPSASSK